ncbi:hypothetical protein J8273_1930 [Carpediemonas membranifera]|uniref:Uncharacterized protein n=1 Tax=Carpediemonas membranifera TaxID=201153 RepID=A0A8J6AXZ7_9EUKA|nr:hypothetical protein J8273_1930 [Carpediemonas membranifera]|eukprot:KAG9396883.1 hypothetical protein J8273_1930 [Carpediemonas membranifera]
MNNPDLLRKWGRQLAIDTLIPPEKHSFGDKEYISPKWHIAILNFIDFLDMERFMTQGVVQFHVYVNSVRQSSDKRNLVSGKTTMYRIKRMVETAKALKIGMSLNLLQSAAVPREGLPPSLMLFTQTFQMPAISPPVHHMFCFENFHEFFAEPNTTRAFLTWASASLQSGGCLFGELIDAGTIARVYADQKSNKVWPGVKLRHLDPSYRTSKWGVCAHVEVYGWEEVVNLVHIPSLREECAKAGLVLSVAARYDELIQELSFDGVPVTHKVARYTRDAMANLNVDTIDQSYGSIKTFADPAVEIWMAVLIRKP